MINILDAIRRGELNAEIAIVISSLSAVAGVGRARSAGLPLKIVRKKDCADLDAFSRQIVDELDAAQVDLVVQGGWLCLWKIPPQYENRVMNIHPALLPCFGGKGMCGHHVHEAVLAAGCKVSGCTVHFCTNEYDKGPIIVQRTCRSRTMTRPTPWRRESSSRSASRTRRRSGSSPKAACRSRATGSQSNDNVTGATRPQNRGVASGTALRDNLLHFRPK